jgi:hypothetical protein
VTRSSFTSHASARYPCTAHSGRYRGAGSSKLNSAGLIESNATLPAIGADHGIREPPSPRQDQRHGDAKPVHRRPHGKGDGKHRWHVKRAVYPLQPGTGQGRGGAHSTRVDLCATRRARQPVPSRLPRRRRHSGAAQDRRCHPRARGQAHDGAQSRRAPGVDHGQSAPTDRALRRAVHVHRSGLGAARDEPRGH